MPSRRTLLNRWGRSFLVMKIGFRGGIEPIATYNQELQATRVAEVLNYYARSEVYGIRRSGTGKKNARNQS